MQFISRIYNGKYLRKLYKEVSSPFTKNYFSIGIEPIAAVVCQIMSDSWGEQSIHNHAIITVKT